MQKNDILLLQKNCPRLRELLDELAFSEKVQKIESMHSSLFSLLRANTGLDYVNASNFWVIEDDITCIRAHNLTLPAWLTDSILAEIKTVNTLFWEVSQ
ncbi:unnamed protein product [Protopolystoma xenopodis]|uniref:Uncharacterized protein n=1 Tax=Protopolystoma xenopodis TaxID=117903 RepID=A0A3S5AGJ0_9PLAT|nr:unnamed protein product [Protopolystoma xenopodis]